MTPSLQRFKDCDRRLHPFIDAVLSRLPEDARTRLLEDGSLQIVALENLHRKCSLRFDFDPPAGTLIYLNFNMLREPQWQIHYNIACEIAGYLLTARGSRPDETAVTNQLIAWGFEEEVEAIGYLQRVAASKGYGIGYNWAIRQNSDYLNQHFGIYFDEWNDHGLGRISPAKIDADRDARAGGKILTDLGKGLPETESIRPSEAILAGILAAVKETRVPESCRR
jgi:hypothetical protein